MEVICPKPFRPSRLYTMRQAGKQESKAATELLDLILNKGDYGAEKSSTQMACSPPFFCGSPPRRASNPIIQDSQFRSNELRPFPATPPSPTARKGGSCGRVSHNSNTVRIEGFNCLSRDHRSISAVA